MCCFVSDQAKEFIGANSNMQQALRLNNVMTEHSAPYTSDNRVVERFIRTLTRKVRCGLFQSAQPHNMWCSALFYAAWTSNFDYYKHIG